MNEELKIIIKAVTDDAKKEIGKVSKEIQGLSGSAKGASGKMGAVFKGVGKAAVGAVAAVAAVTTAIVALGKGTLDTQRNFAKLNTAFAAAGASAKQAGETYNGLYRFLGDSDKATEAAGHLAKITTNQQDLAEWTKISQGIYASFGDSLPIEGLTEAANETLRVGKVTGNMADALNWAGVSEDEFNAKLAATSSLEEREALLRNTLNGLYGNAADIYERNNGALLAYNESQAKLDSTMAAAGAATMPLLTALNNLGSAFFTALKPALDAIIPPLTTFINWIAKAIQSVLGFFGALTGKSTSIKAIGEVGNAAAGAAQNLGSAAQSAKNLGSGMGGAEKAAEGAAKAAEEAKKSTQGFDELNIVSSGKSSSGSGGSGGSGGGSSSPGYAAGGGGGSGLLDTATFGAEVQESEGLAGGLADSIKGVFADLAKVFEPSISAWSGAFDTVKQAWNNAKPDFISGAMSVKEGFKTLGSYLFTQFVPNVVNSFSTNLAPVIGDVFGFVIEEAGAHFAWLGGYVNTTVNDIIIPYLQTVEMVATDVFAIIGGAWAEHGEGLLNAFSTFFETLRGHFDNFYNSVFKPIWDKIVEVFNWVWTNGLKPLVDKLVDAVMVISTELLTLYNKVIAPIVDWIIKNILPPIVKVVNGIIETVGKIIVAISNILGGIIDALKGLIQFIVGVFTGDWGKAWEGIKNFFSGIWDAIKGILELFWEVLKGIANFVIDVVAAAFEIAWELIKGIWSVVVSFFKGIWDGIVFVFSVVVDWFKDIFSKAWEGIKAIWNVVVEWFKGIWDGIVAIFSVVIDWFKDIFSKAWEAIKEVWNVVIDWFKGIWKGISDAFSSVGTWFKDIFSKAWDGVKGIWGGVKTWFSGVWEGIKSVFSSVATFFKDIFSKAWNAVLGVFSATGKVFKGIAEGILNVFKKVVNFIIDGINKVVALPFEGLNKILNKIQNVSVAGFEPFSWLTWRAPVPQLPKLAKGGIIDSATIAMIGEAGKEAVIPLENNTGWMDQLAERLAARSNNPTKIILKVGEKELGWATINAINGITEQTGGLQLAL